MGTQTNTIGGSGTGLGHNLMDVLNRGLMTGVFGGPGGAGAQNGVMGFLNNIFSQGAGNIGGAMSKQLETQQSNDVNAIRSRFGTQGGMAYGTPAAYGESTYRAQAAPNITSAIGNLQLGTMGPILQMMMGLGSKDIPQAETMVQPSNFSQAMGMLAPVAGAAVKGFTGLGSQGGMPSFPSFGTNNVVNQGLPNSMLQMPEYDWGKYLYGGNH